MLSVTRSQAAARGRPRDATIDDDVLDAALRELATNGYAGFSMSAVAEAAGTTRPALYRRWRDKQALIVSAVARLAQVAPPPVTGEPFDDLVAELENFRHCIRAAGSLPLAGLMLGGEMDLDVKAAYLEQIVAPRRARIRALLREGIARGDLDAEADLDVAGTFLTGSWYAFHVAGRRPPRDWAPRTAALVWAACSTEER
jgi:AcrR family transcriptional regulator